MATINAVDGFAWFGTELTIELTTEMPLAAFIVVPSIVTSYESQQSHYTGADNDVSDTHDFDLSDYPYVSVYGDFEEFTAKTLHISTTDATWRYLDRMGIFSACSALDESTVAWTYVPEGCDYAAGSNSDLVCQMDYNIYYEGSEF
jgi:alpha-ketoglutarate-dependent taurine dioxygenase